MKLDKDEKALLESFERGEWERTPHFAEEAQRVKAAAKAAMRKDKRVNIRMSERDLLWLQRRAVEEGLPYQTFIASVLHKFVNGRLRDVG